MHKSDPDSKIIVIDSDSNIELDRGAVRLEEGYYVLEATLKNIQIEDYFYATQRSNDEQV